MMTPGHFPFFFLTFSLQKTNIFSLFIFKVISNISKIQEPLRVITIPVRTLKPLTLIPCESKSPAY